jgi:ArsR family transcriptional regulator
MKTKKGLSFHDLTKNCQSTAKVLKALAHPHRLQLLCHMADGDKTVGELEELCGASQSAVSQFLGRMKSKGLITSHKEGQFVRYEISDPRILKTIKALQEIYCKPL